MNKHKVLLRKCVVSNEQLPKKDLIRVVKSKDGIVKVDLSGKVNGRGAYLKRDLKVIEKAIKTKKLDRHLEITIPNEIYEELLGIFKNE